MGLFQGSFYSDSLKRNTAICVLFPDISPDVLPVVQGVPGVLYLLHGLGGNREEWLRFSKIEYYAKKYNLIVIMPEVERSFYCDMGFGADYFTYVADELPELCGRWLHLEQDRSHTFLAGESMGGYGAVKIGLRRPQRFSAIASLSGVLDYAAAAKRALNGSWTEIRAEELLMRHGPSGLPAEEDDLLELVKNAALDPKMPRLIQFCGTEDFLYADNQRFHAAAEKYGYGHVYSEGAGGHEWPYWDKTIQRAIQFFLFGNPDAAPIY